MYIGKAEIPRATSCDFESCTRECIQLITTKKIKFFSQSVAYVKKESSCLAAGVQNVTKVL